MRNYSENNSGITIVELMITMGIAAILLSMAVLSIDFIRREQVTKRTKEIFADIQRVRSDAISRGTTTTVAAPFKRGVGIRFVSTTAFRLFSFNDNFPAGVPITASGNYAYDSVAEEAEVETRNLTSGRLRIQVGAVLTDPPVPVPNNNVVIFDRFGYPRQIDWQLIGANPNPAMTITVDNPSLANYTRCITIRTNSIREGFWNNATNTCNVQ